MSVTVQKVLLHSFRQHPSQRLLQSVQRTELQHLFRTVHSPAPVQVRQCCQVRLIRHLLRGLHRERQRQQCRRMSRLYLQHLISSGNCNICSSASAANTVTACVSTKAAARTVPSIFFFILLTFSFPKFIFYRNQHRLHKKSLIVLIAIAS